MSAERWARILGSLAEAGIEARLDSNPAYNGQPASWSIFIREGDRIIEVHDRWWRKNPNVWIGYQVHIEGARDSLIKRMFPITKKRGEVVAAVKEALGGK